MAKVTTAHVLADKALKRICGQQCVDWAITMLEEGRDGHYLTMLAGQLPLFNPFVMEDLRDRALVELGIPDMDASRAVRTFAVERFRQALRGEADLVETLALVSDLCIKQDYSPVLYDFYLLKNAYDDLPQGFQYYWPDATAENIVSLIRQRAQQFVNESPETI
jgi:hypothetical protein